MESRIFVLMVKLNGFLLDQRFGALLFVLLLVFQFLFLLRAFVTKIIPLLLFKDVMLVILSLTLLFMNADHINPVPLSDLIVYLIINQINFSVTHIPSGPTVSYTPPVDDELTIHYSFRPDGSYIYARAVLFD